MGNVPKAMYSTRQISMIFRRPYTCCTHLSRQHEGDTQGDLQRTSDRDDCHQVKHKTSVIPEQDGGDSWGGVAKDFMKPGRICPPFLVMTGAAGKFS